MKKLLWVVAFLYAASLAWAGPPITQGINKSDMGAISASSITDTGLTASKPVFTDGSKVLTSSGTLGVNQGGTGATTLDDGGIVIGNVAGAVEVVAPGLTTEILVGGGLATKPAWGADIPTAVTIGTAYIYRVGGTDVSDADVVDDLTITSTKAITGASLGVNSLIYWSSATAEADEGSVTLPTITADYSGHGFVRVSAAGVIADSAEFESGSDGNVSLIRATANVVVGAACANAKICISTAGAQNPIIVQSRNGAAQVEIEFWYK